MRKNAPGEPLGQGVEQLRQRLGMRAVDCLDRLDDVVSELVALHEVDADEILARVGAIIEREERADRRSASG